LRSRLRPFEASVWVTVRAVAVATLISRPA
jgi:hypothetical protein